MKTNSSKFQLNQIQIYLQRYYPISKMFEESDSSRQPNVSFDPARDPSSFTFKSKVQSLGIPNLPLYEPDVETMQATFGMG